MHCYTNNGSGTIANHSASSPLIHICTVKRPLTPFLLLPACDHADITAGFEFDNMSVISTGFLIHCKKRVYSLFPHSDTTQRAGGNFPAIESSCHAGCMECWAYLHTMHVVVHLSKYTTTVDLYLRI